MSMSRKRLTMKQKFGAQGLERVLRMVLAVLVFVAAAGEAAFAGPRYRKDIALSGQELSNLPAQSADACQKICENTQQCTGWTYEVQPQEAVFDPVTGTVIPPDPRKKGQRNKDGTYVYRQDCTLFTGKLKAVRPAIGAVSCLKPCR